MKITRNMKDEFVVFYSQFINSLEGLGMFFSSAALIRRLRKYTATDKFINGPNYRFSNIIGQSFGFESFLSFTFSRKRREKKFSVMQKRHLHCHVLECFKGKFHFTIETSVRRYSFENNCPSVEKDTRQTMT